MVALGFAAKWCTAFELCCIPRALTKPHIQLNDKYYVQNRIVENVLSLLTFRTFDCRQVVDLLWDRFAEQLPTITAVSQAPQHVPGLSFKICYFARATNSVFYEQKLYVVRNPHRTFLSTLLKTNSCFNSFSLLNSKGNSQGQLHLETLMQSMLFITRCNHVKL